MDGGANFWVEEWEEHTGGGEDKNLSSSLCESGG